MFDANNGNTNMKDAELLKLKQIYNFDSSNSLIPAMGTCIPPGHIKIRVHLIYEYKQDGIYKVCMVASGKITGTNLVTYYSSVISLRSMCNVISWMN